MRESQLEQTERASSARGLAAWVDDIAYRSASYLTRHIVWTVLALTICFFAVATMRARSRPFWYDEIWTVILADLPNPSAVVSTVLSGGDLMPPVCHLAIHFADRIFGTGEVVSRFPGMLAFWIYCLCLFHFVVKRAGIYFGIAVALLPAASVSFSFAYEARAHGLLLGCAGLALLSWQAASRNVRRKWSLPGLALSIGIGVLTHYYALMLLVPFAGAEIHRTISRRKFDPSLWAALALGLAPVSVFLPAIKRAIARSVHSWAQPSTRQYLEYYQTEFQLALIALVALLALAGLYAALGGQEEGPRRLPSQWATTPYEWTAAVLFLTVPLIAITGGLLVTHSFTPRYAVVGITGVFLLAPLTLCRATRGSATAGLIFVLAAAAPFAGQAAAGLRKFENPLDGEPMLRKALNDSEAVVLTDGLLFLKLWYYAPEDVKQRLVYLADPDAAVAHGGWPTLDGELLYLRGHRPIWVAKYGEFVKSRKQFLIYFDAERPAWQLSQILADGGALEIVQRNETRSLMRARM